MLLQVYADDQLVYDNRHDDYKLLALTSTSGLNKGGTATLTMPPNHPAYNSFVGHRTLVEIYKDHALVWRGRALYPSDDFFKRRTITCEGERCFLRDATMRPYLFQDAPAAIFEQLVSTYNSQVEIFKQFKLGTCDVKDPNNYVRLESSSAEQVLDTLDKLVERCGGYITFTTNADGDRVINWRAQLNYANNQAIEFGENLLDYARTDANTDLVTVVIPYGAQLEDGNRVTIESVNDGLDFIQDHDAVYLRGVISRPVYWDDITEPRNLLAKAQQYLNERKNAITALTLSAFDLATLDQNFDTFQVGDLVRVRSAPHGVDTDFLLEERTEDHLNPASGSVTLGKELRSLTGADAAGDRDSANALNRVERNIRAEYTLNAATILAETKETLTSLITQAAEEIKLEVSQTFATNDEVKSLISTTMTQLKDSFEFLFTELQTVVDANDTSAREQFELIEKYIRFVDGNIILGESGNELELHIENDIIKFLSDGAEVAYFSNKQMVVTDGEFLHSLIVGNIGVIPRKNGNTSIVLIKGNEEGEG
jgi:phage minor structural protein